MTSNPFGRHLLKIYKKKKISMLEISSDYFQFFSRLGNSPLRFHLFFSQALLRCRFTGTTGIFCTMSCVRKAAPSGGYEVPALTAAHREGDSRERAQHGGDNRTARTGATSTSPRFSTSICSKTSSNSVEFSG